MKATAACALPKSGEGGEPKQQIFLFSSLRMSRLTCVTAAKSLRPSTAIRLGLARLTASVASRAQTLRAGLPLEAIVRGRPLRSRHRCAGAALGATQPRRVLARGSPTAPTSSPSSRKSRITGRKQCGSAQTARWSCRGSLICGGAATIWCLNRRAPPRCLGFTIQISPRSWPNSRPRKPSASYAG